MIAVTRPTEVRHDRCHRARLRRRSGPLIGPDGSYTGAGQTLAFTLGVLSLPIFPLAVTGALLYTNAEERSAPTPTGRAGW